MNTAKVRRIRLPVRFSHADGVSFTPTIRFAPLPRPAVRALANLAPEGGIIRYPVSPAGTPETVTVMGSRRNWSQIRVTGRR